MIHDITGLKFGKLTVIRKTTEKRADGRYLWECKCECGNIIRVPANSLKTGNTTTCGCFKYENAKKHDLVGRIFGRLTVISREEVPTWYKCKCTCGNEKKVRGSDLLNGNYKSCGCLERDLLLERNQKMATHHMSRSRLYCIWNDMKTRCTYKKNKDYMNYGGRGISFCDEWKDFEPFLAWALNNGYMEHLTLERVDVNGNYEPANCKWVTLFEQGSNRTTNRYIECDGERKTIAEWARVIGISRQGLRYRLEAGWKIEDLLTDKDQGKKRTGQITIKNRALVIKGQKKSISEWSKEIGISTRALNDRIKNGWSEEEILYPSGTKRKK